MARWHLKRIGLCCSIVLFIRSFVVNQFLSNVHSVQISFSFFLNNAIVKLIEVSGISRSTIFSLLPTVVLVSLLPGGCVSQWRPHVPCGHDGVGRLWEMQSELLLDLDTDRQPTLLCGVWRANLKRTARPQPGIAHIAAIATICSGFGAAAHWEKQHALRPTVLLPCAKPQCIVVSP